MPKFFFTTNDSKTLDISDEGVEFPDEKSAADDAQRSLVDIARDQLPDGNRADFSVKVENEQGDEIYRASLQFRGQSAQDARRAAEENDAAADKAAEAIAIALGSKPESR